MVEIRKKLGKQRIKMHKLLIPNPIGSILILITIDYIVILSLYICLKMNVAYLVNLYVRKIDQVIFTWRVHAPSKSVNQSSGGYIFLEYKRSPAILDITWRAKVDIMRQGGKVMTMRMIISRTGVGSTVVFTVYDVTKSAA